MDFYMKKNTLKYSEQGTEGITLCVVPQIFISFNFYFYIYIKFILSP